MGQDSLAMWMVDPDMRGWSSRSGAAALAAGLQHRRRETLLRDLLAYERQQGLSRPRSAGLNPVRERALLATLAASELDGRATRRPIGQRDTEHSPATTL
jgi:hypothetical protein